MKLRWLIFATLAIAACEKSDGKAPAREGGPPSKGAPSKGGPGRAIEFPVEAKRVESESMQYSISAVGTLEAFERVQVTARVAGAVERVRFKEGDVVKKDEVLVEIEPDRYRLAVEAAKAMLEKASASASDAEAGMARREAASAKNPGLIRGEEVETFRMRARTAAAEHLAAKTALEQAQLNLRDALVRAPLAGQVQTRSVQTGQYVQPGTVLATMVRRDPLLLRFKVPERDAAPLASGMFVDFTTRGGTKTHRAKITLVSEMADPTSRMVDVTAEVVPADAQEVKPGAFAEVAITHGTPREVPVIPQTAIRPSERGFLAYVVEDGVAKSRVLQLGMRSESGLVEVKDGLRAGELLVIRGSEALRDGAKVRISEAPAGPAQSDADREKTKGGAP